MSFPLGFDYEFLNICSIAAVKSFGEIENIEKEKVEEYK